MLSLSIDNTSIYFAKYVYEMEQALWHIRKNVEQLIFVEKVGLEDGMSRRASEELWQYENRYDSDNVITFDSDNDSNVGGCDSDG